ncbi:hypothetical protein ACSQ67_008592 [Phaseolus vulgaris]
MNEWLTLKFQGWLKVSSMYGHSSQNRYQQLRLLREECAYDACNISSNVGVNSKETEDGTKGTSLVNLFAEAIKGPLLSSDIPFHPVQCATLKLIYECISECPGSVSISQLEELILVLISILRKYSDGEMALDLSKSIAEATRHAILACLSVSERNINQILQCLYLLKEAYAYSHDGNSSNSSKLELKSSILDTCRAHLLPWLVMGINEMEEDIALGLLETFHSILLLQSSINATEYAETLISVGNYSGQPIREAVLHLSHDPIDLLFLLGQRSTNSLDLPSCQSAVLLILYTSSLYDERLADEKLILASLEQYILLNRSDFHCRTSDSMNVTRLVNLYSLLRGFDNTNYQIHYSGEAEEIIFQLINNDERDLLSARIHTVSLKWLFQQDNIINSLCHQILKFCRSYNFEETDIILGNNNQTVNVQTLSELVSTEDNNGARVFVCLLAQLLEEERHECDVVCVLNVMATMVHVCPTACEQLSQHGMATTIRSWFYLSNSLLTATYMSILILVFNTLSSVNPETLSADQNWVAIMEYSIPSEKVDILSDESLFVIDILSLILHLSTKKTLEETSKAVLFNTSIISMVNTVVSAASLKGPALVEHDEGTSTGETLIFVLLLHYFAVKSLHAILPGFVDWPSFLVSLKPSEPLAFIGIRCHDLCRLLHFGSPVIKIAASYSLLELFNRISDQINSNHEELRCTVGSALASQSFMNKQSPQVLRAIAVLKLRKIPQWMRSVFDKECRKCIYTNNAQEGLPNEEIKKVLTASYDTGDICEFLIDLMTSEAYVDTVSRGFHTGSKKLSEEIEMFYTSLSVDDGGCSHATSMFYVNKAMRSL